ncbi:MAG: ferrous iron transport protein A [Candidatus Brocadiia bacterium]
MSAHAEKAADGAGVLSSVPEGRRVRVVALDAGRGMAARLAAMGVVPGVELLVVNNRGAGPVVVEVKGTRLALGRGMALKILVR